MASAVQDALSKIRRARSIDEGDRHAEALARAARKNPRQVIDLFRAARRNANILVWCLHGLTTAPVLDLFRRALRHNDPDVRWAAIEGLKYCSRTALIPDFVAALSDRSDLVKAVAVEWLASHGDFRAIEPLKRLTGSPRMRKNSPGTVRQAEAALRLLGKGCARGVSRVQRRM